MDGFDHGVSLKIPSSRGHSVVIAMDYSFLKDDFFVFFEGEGISINFCCFVLLIL